MNILAFGNRRVAAIWGFILLAGLLVGCSKGRPDRVHVSGKITIDGQPLKTGAINFFPNPSRGRGSIANIEPDGSFNVYTFEKNDGCPTGNYDLRISSLEYISDTKTKWNIPPRYADASTSGISVTVDGPQDDLLIELTWKGSNKTGPYIVTTPE